MVRGEEHYVPVRLDERIPVFAGAVALAGELATKFGLDCAINVSLDTRGGRLGQDFTYVNLDTPNVQDRQACFRLLTTDYGSMVGK